MLEEQASHKAVEEQKKIEEEACKAKWKKRRGRRKKKREVGAPLQVPPRKYQYSRLL